MKKILIAIALLFFSVFSAQAKDAKETAYERIMRTGTIRCGYIAYEPGLTKDLTTGAFGGIFYDLISEIAKRLSLKVEMTVESSWGNVDQDMRTGKADIMCMPAWSYLPYLRGHLVTSDPVYYNAIGVYVRKGDDRFTNKLSGINDPSVTIEAIDATISQDIAREDYPKAKVHSSIQGTDYTYNVINLLAKKSDVTFVDPDFAERFLAKQKEKGELVNIAKDKPIRLFGVGFLLPMGEVELEQMINMSIEALHNEGFIEKLLQKYEASLGSLIRVAPGYQLHAPQKGS